MSARQRNSLRRLRKYSRRLNRMIEDGSFSRLPEARRDGLVRRVGRLYRGLLDVVDEATLRSILAAAAVIVLGLPACSGSSTRIGGDGTVDPRVDPHADTGLDPHVDPHADTGLDPWVDPGYDPGHDPGYDPTTPNIFTEAGRLNPFGIDTMTHRCGWVMIPAFANIDADGDVDLFTGTQWYEYTSCLQYFQNTGTPTSPAFATPVLTPFGISGSDSSGAPTLVDIDGDGDLDLFVGSSGYYYRPGGIRYFQNTGTPGSPAFASSVSDPFGISGARGYMSIPQFVDIDADGDQDLFLGGYEEWYYGTGGIQYLQNTGTSRSPSFAPPVPEPFGIRVSGWMLAPAFADLDRDGDQDLFVGGSMYDSGGLAYFQNIGSPTSPAFAPRTSNPFGLRIPFYTAFPAFADLDSDGDMDLLLGANYSLLIYYENTTL